MTYLHTSGLALQSIGIESLMSSSASPPPQPASSSSRAAMVAACFMLRRPFDVPASVRPDRLNS